MKIAINMIIAMLFVGGVQLMSMERPKATRTVTRGLSRAGRATWRGFEVVMRSGIDLTELHRKIEQKHKNAGNAYEGLK